MRWLLLAGLLLAPDARAEELPALYDLRRGLRWVADVYGTPIYVTSDDRLVMEGLDALRTNTRALKLVVRDELDPIEDQCWIQATWASPSWTLVGSGRCQGTWYTRDWAPLVPRSLGAPRVGQVMGAAALGQLAGAAAGAGATLIVCGVTGVCQGDGGGGMVLLVGSLAVGHLVGGTTGAVLGGGREFGLPAGIGAAGLTLTGFGVSLAARDQVGFGIGFAMFLAGPTVGSATGAAGAHAARKPPSP